MKKIMGGSLNKLPYGRGSHAGSVGYRIFESLPLLKERRSCVFTGLKKGATSTINATEEIVEAILLAERIPAPGFAFFDLQTTQSYEMNPGSFRLDRLWINRSGGNGFYIIWRPTECPLEVYQVFKELIGYPLSVPAFVRRQYPSVSRAVLIQKFREEVAERQRWREIADLELSYENPRVYSPKIARERGYKPAHSSTAHYPSELLMLHQVPLKRGDEIIVDGQGHPEMLYRVDMHGKTGRFSIWEVVE